VLVTNNLQRSEIHSQHRSHLLNDKTLRANNINLTATVTYVYNYYYNFAIIPS